MGEVKCALEIPTYPGGWWNVTMQTDYGSQHIGGGPTLEQALIEASQRVSCMNGGKKLALPLGTLS